MSRCSTCSAHGELLESTQSSPKERAQERTLVQVSLSSLNRHAVATRADVGLPKATVLARHLKNIVPEARVEPCVMMYTRQKEDAILGGDRKPDFVIDCIDDMDTKVRPAWRPHLV